MRRVIKEEYDSFVNEISKVEKELAEVQFYKGNVAIYQGDAWHDNPIFRETEVREKHLIAKLRNMRQKLLDMKVEQRDSSMLDLNKILYPDLVTKEDAFIEDEELIKEKQNNIIMQLNKNNMLVSGVPGSGLNLILLHKIAYLIYHYQYDNSRILLIDQNSFSKSYNSYFLSKLTPDNIAQSTFIDIINNYINEKMILNKTDATKNKISEYKSSIDFKNSLDAFMNEYFDKYFVNEDFKIDDTVVYTKDYIKQMLLFNVNKQPNYEWALMRISMDFKEKNEEICQQVSQKYVDLYTKYPFGDPKRKEYIEQNGKVIKMIKKDGLKLLRAYFKKITAKTTEVYQMFIENIEKYCDTLNNEEISILKKQSLELLNKKKITIDDIPALIHINYLLNGSYEKNEKNEKYDYIFINNTYEFGSFHFLALKEMFENTIISFYEDKYLSEIINGEEDKLSKVNNEIFDNKFEYYNMSESYRLNNKVIALANKLNEREINSYCNNTLESEIDFIDTCDEKSKIKLLNRIKNNECGKSAIVCSNERIIKSLSSIIKKMDSNIDIISNNYIYNGNPVIIKPDSISGLEFDTIVLYNLLSETDFTSKEDLFQLYKTLISAKNKLIIIDNQKLKEIIDMSTKEKSNSIINKLVYNNK